MGLGRQCRGSAGRECSGHDRQLLLLAAGTAVSRIACSQLGRPRHNTSNRNDERYRACMVRSVDDCVHLLALLAPESADIGNDRPPPYLHVIALIRNFYCCLILPQLLLHPSTGRLSTFLRLAKRCRGPKK